MTAHTVIFFGPTGSGKGTQAAVLKEYLEATDPTHPTYHFQAGKKFRELAQGDDYTGGKVRSLLEEGALLPTFLPIWLWSGLFVECLKGEEHLLIDGFPRHQEEASVLEGAFKFFGREKVHVVILHTDPETILQRLREKRQREDDGEEEVRRRIAWYEECVRPSIEFFAKNPRYHCVDIDGSLPIEEVQRQIRAALDI